MVKKIKSCVFISGRGSNLTSIVKNSKSHDFPIKIELIISNNMKADGLKYAKKHNIPFKFYSSLHCWIGETIAIRHPILPV